MWFAGCGLLSLLFAVCWLLFVILVFVVCCLLLVMLFAVACGCCDC